MRKRTVMWEKAGRPFREDRVLVDEIQHTRKSQKHDLAVEELWAKFDKLRTKLKFKLIGTINNFGMVMREDINEFEGRSFETFMNAVSKVRLPDCAHIPNWSIYRHLWGYWMTMNRDLVKEYLLRAHSTTPIKAVLKNDGKSVGSESSASNLDVQISHTYVSIDDALEAQEKRELFWDVYRSLEATMTKRQKKLIDLRQQGFSQRKIREKLRITCKEYSQEIDTVKSRFAHMLSVLSSSRGGEVNYDEIVNYFG